MNEENTVTTKKNKNKVTSTEQKAVEVVSDKQEQVFGIEKSDSYIQKIETFNFKTGKVEKNLKISI